MLQGSIVGEGIPGMLSQVVHGGRRGGCYARMRREKERKFGHWKVRDAKIPVWSGSGTRARTGQGCSPPFLPWATSSLGLHPPQHSSSHPCATSSRARCNELIVQPDFNCASLEFRPGPTRAREQHKHPFLTASMMELRKLPCVRCNAHAHCHPNVVALDLQRFEDFRPFPTQGLATLCSVRLLRVMG